MCDAQPSALPCLSPSDICVLSCPACAMFFCGGRRGHLRAVGGMMMGSRRVYLWRMSRTGGRIGGVIRRRYGRKLEKHQTWRAAHCRASRLVTRISSARGSERTVCVAAAAAGAPRRRRACHFARASPRLFCAATLACTLDRARCAYVGHFINLSLCITHATHFCLRAWLRISISHRRTGAAT